MINIAHGGGPLPILGDKDHKTMVTWLSTFASKYLSKTPPTSCLVISAHWEASEPTIQSGDTSSLYYDYYGFPDEAYSLTYPVKPAKELAQRIHSLLDQAGIKNKFDKERGFDHGVFIPMKIIFPDAQIPTIQLSLVSGLDPEFHVKLGEALAPLRDEGVFILGSGMSYHNMRGFGDYKSNQDSEPFHKYLRDALADDGKSFEEKARKLIRWKKDAPKAKECHPREEHLIPLMSIFGTSKSSGGKGKEVFFDDVVKVKSAGYIFE
jgi:4,5-DOPA dioxygenase extradiol